MFHLFLVDSQVESSLGTSQASQHCYELLSPTPQTSSPDANDQESTDLELVTSASVTVDSLGMVSAVATTRVSKPLQMPNSSVKASVNQSSSLTMVSASACT